MITVLISHPLYKPGMDAINGKADLIIPNNGDSDIIIEDLKKADGFILRIGKIDRKAIDACEKLKVITRPGVGVDNVDVQAATERGIPVVICPAANARAVAEHTLALIFGISKNIVESDVETRKGNFGIRNKYAAVELLGKTVSVIGLGNIGRTVAQLCAGVGMKVCAYDPFLDRKDVEALGYTYAGDLQQAVEAGDYVSLHMPSMPETRNMINSQILAAMKKSAFLINCARGDIVDETALFEALKNESIAGAAVDVLADEPMKAEHPLMKLSNLIVSPHMAAQTRETTSAVVTMAVQGTLAVIEGEKWPHVCNPEVYEHPKWKGV
ncbi:phosphoglycerate dehydrogenase [Marispirochaeta aestuarii]|uniref:Phosphoglycerate dehydrogenase n=1 Tax=Marispirochaeta aestuarii TaxID=1963862 RepID=A0A1Y1S3H2_9SPIO|nr:hydroxyacid dehydrogenase [Marispirochaeta aestuarii]ORC37961.1 phosphoglycerate dehydrogenase [Marispirochaeta aestuarii]